MTISEESARVLMGKFLSHVQDAGYNPEERRRRYLLERQLKGRSPAQGKPATVGRKSKGVRSVARKSGANLGKADAARKASKERVAAIEGRLGNLHKVLKSLLAEKKSGKTKPKTEAKAKGSEKATGQEAKKQAEASKKHYEKNKTEILKKEKVENAKDSDKSIDEKIKSVRTQIKAVQIELASARKKVSTR